MTKKKSSERFTLLQRTIMRLALEMGRAEKAAKRGNIQIELKDLIHSPQIMEHILALDVLGMELIERQVSRKAVLSELSKHDKEDYRALRTLRGEDEEEDSDCDHCGEPLCDSCGACHKCSPESKDPHTNHSLN